MLGALLGGIALLVALVTAWYVEGLAYDRLNESAEDVKRGKDELGGTSGVEIGCRMPPEGWSCSRKAGHEGPCAAIPQIGRASCRERV